MYQNVHRKGSALSPADIFPSLKISQAGKEQKLTAAEFGEFLKAMTIQMGGDVK